MSKHQVEIEVRWGDMDAYGHVNNTLFFRYFETARLRYFEDLLKNNDIAMPTVVLAEMSCRFLQPLVYPATIVVGCRVSRLGSSSFDLKSDIYEGDNLCASSKATLVWVNPKTHRPEQIPANIRQVISHYENLAVEDL